MNSVPAGWCVDNNGEAVPVFKNRVIAFGRAEFDPNDTRVTRVQINDMHISTTHCYIWLIQFDSRTSCICYLKDVSRNSCYVNNRVVGTNNYCIIHDGDYVKLYKDIGFRFNLNSTFSDAGNIIVEKQSKIRDWVITKEVIGIGTFGKVQIAYNERENKENKFRFYAVKSTLLNKDNERSKIEHTILSSLKHKNIIRIKETIIDSNKGIIMMFQDLAIGGDLFSYLSQDQEVLQKIPESDAIYILYQICNALYYLHSKGIVHRDLKLDNILIMGVPIRFPNIVIGDFGIAKRNQSIDNKIELNKRGMIESQEKFFDNNKRELFRMKTMVGTAEYAAPEINLLKKVSEKDKGNKFIDEYFLKREIFENEIGADTYRNETGSYNEKIDSWSLGVIAHILFSGISPFYSDSLEMTVNKSRKGLLFLHSSRWEGVSGESKDFVRKLLRVNSKERLSVGECLRDDIFCGTSGKGCCRKEWIKRALDIGE